MDSVRASTFTYDIDFPTAVVTLPAHLSYAGHRPGGLHYRYRRRLGYGQCTYTNFPNQIDLFIKQSTSGIFLSGSGWVNTETPVSVDTAGASVALGSSWAVTSSQLDIETYLASNSTYTVWARARGPCGQPSIQLCLWRFFHHI